MENILEIKNLTVNYNNVKNNKTTTAIKDLSLCINNGEIYALAGESGCGKTTVAKSIMRLIKPEQGEIKIFNNNIWDNKNYYQIAQMIFQNPYSSLNPRLKIKDILQEPLDINLKITSKEKNRIIDEIIDEVGLSQNSLNLYPHEFSGGQRQRIAIARALILSPKIIIADEPVSALDASIQAQIINLLKELKNKKNLTILFISHDLNVIRYIADRVGIMHNGKIIEENSTTNIFKKPQNEYTKLLLKSSPNLKL